MRRRSHVRFTIQIRNSAAASTTVILEPWTTERTLGAGETLAVRVEGDASSPLRIEVADDAITVCSFDTAGALLEFCE